MSRRFEVRPTLLDRAVLAINPERGLKRLQVRAQVQMLEKGGFVAGKRDRRSLNSWLPGGGSPASDILPDLSELRERSRDLKRNDPIAGSVISTKVVHVVGTGHRCIPQIDAKVLGLSDEVKEEWETNARRVWKNWASSKDADITRTQCFSELEVMTFTATLESGDCLVPFRSVERPGTQLSTCLQVIEADRISSPGVTDTNPRIRGGVEFDDNGAPVYYNVRRTHPGDFRGKPEDRKWDKIPAFTPEGRRNVLHLMHRERPDQPRGVPVLAPVIEELKQISDYTSAELMAAVMNACFAIGIKSIDADGSSGLSGDKTTAAGDPIKITEPGTVFDILPGEEIQSFTPGRPSAGFDGFVNAVARRIGAGTDIPFELLMKMFNSSYTASKGALEVAYHSFFVSRARHVSGFCQPVYEQVITEAIARGILDAPGFFSDPMTRSAWLGALWIGTAKISIDPARESKADETYHKMGVKSLGRITAEKFGVDWEDEDDRIVKEDKRQADRAPAPDEAPPAQEEAAA